MVTLEEIKNLVDSEVRPLKAKIAEYEKKIAELEKSQKFLSDKYDQLLKQIQAGNEKRNKIEQNVNKISVDLVATDRAVDDLAQYLRRDCVEITGLKPTADQPCEDIVYSLGHEMGLELDEQDISTVHPLPTFGESSKIIVKFTRRDTRNEFYANRKKIAGRKVSHLQSLRDLQLEDPKADQKVYISESLTPFRKKLFGAVNKAKKKLQWKYIWTNNGRIYLKQSDNSPAFPFDSADDLANFERQYLLSPSNLTKNIRTSSR